MLRLNRFYGLAVLFGALVISSSPTMSAPKATKRQSAPSTTPRAKWEYCYVVASVPLAQGQGVAAYLPQGRQLFIPFTTDGFKAIAQMLNRLGDQGWQVVGYQDATGRESVGQSWTLMRRK